VTFGRGELFLARSYSASVRISHDPDERKGDCWYNWVVSEILLNKIQNRIVLNNRQCLVIYLRALSS
jgi:hypothetical protein